MEQKLKTIALHAALVAGALVVSAGALYLIVLGDKTFREKTIEDDAKTVRESELNILEAEDRLAAGRAVEPVKDKLIDMEESFLSNDQMRRRLLALGDIYMLQYKKEEDDHERKLDYDLAVKSYERASEFCKGPGKEVERNEILRRTAEMYYDNKDYAKALQTLQRSKELQTLPADRWRFKMIEADCLRSSEKPYGSATAFASVADECEDKAIWGDAIVRHGETLLDVASDPKLIKLYLSKDGLAPIEGELSAATIEDERKKLISVATDDFEKAITKMNSFDNPSAAAKLGLLRISVLKKDKKGAYEIVNAIQSSPMLMRDKAESLVVLARLHESVGEYKKAINLLETCSQNYPLTSMFIPVSLDLYEYYKKADEWEKAFTVTERIVMRGPDTATIRRLIDDLSPENSEMLDLIRGSSSRDHYIDRLQVMLDKIKATRPEAWKLIQHQANLILSTLLFISDKYPQAEKAIAGSLAVPMVPKNISDELLHLDLQCALLGNSSPAVIIIRAKRYLHSFPVGKYYQDALAAMLDAYFDMGLYESALEISRRLYMDDLMRRSANGKPSKYWIRTVARIGECYAKLGEKDPALYDRANMVLRDNAKSILASESPYEAFKTWAKIAESRGQVYEAMRRFDIVIPFLKDPSEKASMIVARYLLQLKVGNDKDFEANRELLAKIGASDKISADLKHGLRCELYRGLLEFAFRAKPDAVPELLGEIMKEFKGESWPQYWILLALSKLYGQEALDTMSRKYEETLSGDSAFQSKDSLETVQFIRKQLELIQKLLVIDDKSNKLKTERGL